MTGSNVRIATNLLRVALGIATRYVALALLPVLAGATYVHAPNGWVFTSAGGGWEYPVFLIVVSVVVALLEKGRLPGVRQTAAAVQAG